MHFHCDGVAAERKDQERLEYRTTSKMDSLSDFLKKNGKRWVPPFDVDIR